MFQDYHYNYNTIEVWLHHQVKHIIRDIILSSVYVAESKQKLYII